jgi:hypothetical protein
MQGTEEAGLRGRMRYVRRQRGTSGYKVAERVRRPLEAKTTSSVIALVGTWPTPYSADDAKRSSQALGMSASRHPRNMVWAMFRQWDCLALGGTQRMLGRGSACLNFR